MSNDAAVLQKIRETLAPKLASVTLEIYGANGREPFNFQQGLEPLSQCLMAFWRQHGRMPEIIFNDGLPQAWLPALSQAPDLLEGLVSQLIWNEEFQMGGESNYGQVYESTTSIFTFNCKMWAQGSVTFNKLRRSGELEFVETIVEPIQGPQNSRFVFKDREGENHYTNTPRSNYTGGAFQTWGVLLVLLDRPDFVYATDEGLFLTMDGVAMVERSLHYWLRIATRNELQLQDESVVFAKLGLGPVMRGVPWALIDKLKTMLVAKRAANAPLRQIFKWVMSFVGFYFGGAAVNGLLSGAFTIPNFSGTLQIVSKFGVETGDLQSGLKIVGALTGPTNLFNNLTTGVPAMGDEDFTGWVDDWGDVVPSDFALDASAWDFGPGSDTWFDDWGSDAFADLGVDPADFGNAQDAFSEALQGDWGTPFENLGDEAQYAQDMDILAHYMEGPASVTQYAAAVGATPAGTAAAQAVMRAAGGSPTNPNTSPQTTQRAQQIAAQQAQQAQQSGNWDIATVMNAASKLLGMYGQYEQIQLQRQRGLPRSIQYPGTQSGAITRQPNGGITVRRPDGSMTTILPDGRTVNTAQGFSLPSFLAENKTLLILGAAGLVAAAIVFMPSRR